MESEWIRWISTAILGWIAYEMRGLRHDVQHRVPYSDCNRRMDEQRDKMEKIEAKVQANSEDIAAIRECHNRMNPDAKLTKRKRRNNDDETEDFT